MRRTFGVGLTPLFGSTPSYATAVEPKLYEQIPLRARGLKPSLWRFRKADMTLYEFARRIRAQRQSSPAADCRAARRVN